MFDLQKQIINKNKNSHDTGKNDEKSMDKVETCICEIFATITDSGSRERILTRLNHIQKRL